ncbi:MAG: DUF559 domain-containing protein [Ignavibacteriales bacterium]|nr:DUF559 domain-containing protein [Ignavibacteriales bacterium]
MAKIFNRKKQKRLRQAFRNSPTKAEALVWSALKGKQLSGFKFRRQQGVGSYILDFYCPMAKLGVEIDGETQWTKRERLHDQRKEDYIGKFGLE